MAGPADAWAADIPSTDDDPGWKESDPPKAGMIVP